MRTSAKRAVFGAAIVLLLAHSAAKAQDLSKIDIKTVRVAGTISMLIGAGGNVGVCAGADGALLVDSQFPEVAEKIKAAVAALGPGPIRFVLNTNWHYDHVNGNELLGRAGAVIVAHETSRRHMLAEQTIPELDPSLKIGPYPKEALPVITVKDVLTLDFNGEEIRVLHVPSAHSEGDLLFRFVRANVIQTGDLVFSSGFPFIHISAGGTLDGMIRAADTIIGLCDDRTKIIPGHGPLTDRAGVLAFKDLLVASKDRISALVKQGKSLEDVLAAKPVAGLYKRGESSFPADAFVKVAYWDLTGKYRGK